MSIEEAISKPAPFYVQHRGGKTPVKYVIIHDRAYRISPRLKTSKLFFGVNNVAIEENNVESVIYYESPEAYFYNKHSKPKRLRGDTEEEYNEKMNAFVTLKQEFMNQFSYWKTQQKEILDNPSTKNGIPLSYITDEDHVWRF